jgi:crotonobetainyl-CoA:carnitine CoA-transferase CaiB-like acyl-CoA transferase
MGPLDHLADEHLQSRGAFFEVDHAEVGTTRHCANPVRMSRTRQRPAAAAPLLGAHTEEVLREVLGVGEAEIADLMASGICS